ncbi:MAG: hypothetical protein AVO34_14035 [Firmicutes bacterium ML8_F2]|nr:MAG: hypothetical protein AVO34_14035 [Firmicutes bacterium ML8_F2]
MCLLMAGVANIVINYSPDGNKPAFLKSFSCRCRQDYRKITRTSILEKYIPGGDDQRAVHKTVSGHLVV